MKAALAAAVVALIAVPALAFGFPPAVLTSDADSITLGDLECGTEYQITLSDGTTSENYTRSTAACPSSPPTAEFSIDPDPAQRTKPTTFASTGTCDASPCTFRWFHGGASSTDAIGTGESVSFTYTGGVGPRTVTLKVTDSQGREAVSTRTFQLVQPPTATPSPTPTPEPTPEPTGRPGPDNTGDPDVANNTTRTGITVTAAGTVLENVTAPYVVINAPDVTIRDSTIGPNSNPVVNNSSNLLIEDTTVRGANTGGTSVSWGGYTARRLDVSGNENGFNAGSNSTIVDSWIHDLYTGGGAHSDGIQTSGSGAGNIVIRRNFIDPVPGGSGATAPIILHTGGDPQNHDVWIEDNWLDGGGSSVALYCARQDAPRVYVNRNRMLKGVYGQYTDSCSLSLGSVTEFYDNVDMNTGAPIPGSPSSSSSSLPDASNTGVPAGTDLTASGAITTSSAGQVIDSQDITGSVTVNHANVTIRRSRITSNGFNVVDNNSTGLVVEDSELLDGPDTGQANCHNGIGMGGYTIRRSEITGCENAIDAADGNATVADNYIHDLDTEGPSHVWGNSPHTDGMQVAGDNVNILHNWVDPTAGSGATAAIIMDVSASGNRNVVIEDNYLDGRGSSYALYAPRYQMSGNKVNRNRMLRGVGGYAACVKVGITVDEFDGNVDHATGAALSASQMDNGSGCSN